MQVVLTRVTAFVLTLMIGIAVDSLVGPLLPNADIDLRRLDDNVRSQVFFHDVRPITINSVPDADFPTIVKTRRPFLHASVRFTALFDANGSITSVRPYPMIPFGVDESAAGSGEFADVTPFMVDWRFVDSLPQALTESAIQQVLKINYKPKSLDGRPVSQRVFVLTEYSYSESRFAVGCSTIDLTIMDETGILWSGNTWVSRNMGCVLI
jgi:hypothetical protein